MTGVITSPILVSCQTSLFILILSGASDCDPKTVDSLSRYGILKFVFQPEMSKVSRDGTGVKRETITTLPTLETSMISLRFICILHVLQVCTPRVLLIRYPKSF